MKISCLVAGAVLALAAARAHAAVTVLGGGLAQACSHAAIAGRSDNDSIQLCDRALDTETLDTRDRAGTFINRGVMELRRRDFAASKADFDVAVAVAPRLGEGWVNRGAVLVGEKDYRGGLEDLNRGLELGVSEPEKAYFNRALAYEGLDDEKSAYLDYQHALAIKPGWDLPKHELLRFTVTHR